MLGGIAVVQRHALHRDELGGGGRAKNVHNSNYFPTQKTITPNRAIPAAREPVPALTTGFAPICGCKAPREW